MTTDIPLLTLADLDRAYQGSWYFIAGCGAPLDEWTTGYEDLLAEEEIGKPSAWYQVSGETVNRYAEQGGNIISYHYAFQSDIACLLFPLDRLHTGRLAIFKILMQDRWFDDVIDNMRRH